MPDRAHGASAAKPRAQGDALDEHGQTPMDRPSKPVAAPSELNFEPGGAPAPVHDRMHDMTEHLMVALQSQHDLVSVIQALTENIPFGEADCEAVWRSARRNLPYKNTVDDATVPTAAYRCDAVGRVVVDDGPTRIDSQSGAYELDSQSGAHELLLLLALVSRVRLVLIRSLQTGQEVTRALELYRNLQTEVAGILKRKVMDRLCELNAPGLKWLKIGHSETTNGQELANSTLAEALTRKTEFTQGEWDAFGVQGLDMNHFVESGGSCFKPAPFLLESRIDEAVQTVIDLALRTTAAFEIICRDVQPSGLKWLKAGDTKPATGRNLENSELAEALTHKTAFTDKTEFTQQEWEAFARFVKRQVPDSPEEVAQTMDMAWKRQNTGETAVMSTS